MMRQVSRILGSAVLTCLVGSSGCSIAGPTAPYAELDCTPVRLGGAMVTRGAWSADGRYVFYASAFDAYGRRSFGLHRVDVRTGHEHVVAPPVWTLDLLPSPIPGSTEIMLDFGWGLALLDLATGVTTPIPAPDPLTQATWFRDGESLYVFRSANNNDPPEWHGVHIMHKSGRGLRQFKVPGRLPFYANGTIEPSPDGRRLAFVDTVSGSGDLDFMKGEIAVMNPDGTGYRRLTRLGQFLSNPQWTPDGRTIVFLQTDSLCYVTSDNPPVRTMAVDVATGWTRPWPRQLGTREFALSRWFSIHPVTGDVLRVDRHPTLFPMPDGSIYPVGTLFVQPLGGGMAKLLARSSDNPPPPDSMASAPMQPDLFKPSPAPPEKARPNGQAW